MKIPHDRLTTGATVWYAYGDNSPEGPFTVIGFYGNYQGRHVSLHRLKDDRDVLLADDEDFGVLTFYDSNPSINTKG